MIQTNHTTVPFNKTYYILGILCFSFYGVSHGISGNLIVAASCLINCIALGSCILVKTSSRLKAWHNDMLILCLSVTLIVVCSQLGMRGLIIGFPLIFGYFYYYPQNDALKYSIAFLIPALVASCFAMPVDMVLCTLIPFTMTIVISYLCADKVAKQKRKLQDEAEYDYLTHSQNRRSLMRWLSQHIADKDPIHSLSLLFLDIDNFKFINDQFGHSFGDKILCKIAGQMKLIQQQDELSGQQTLLARVAGDGFVLALCGKHDHHFLQQFGEKVLSKINQHYAIGEVKLQVNLTMGIATAGKDCTIDELVHKADVAMYKAKQLGKNRVALYNDALAKEVQQRNTVSTLLKEALENNDFFLVFMPLYDSQATHIVGAEALIRCSNEGLSVYGPDVYIPIAEEQGLIGEIDFMVIEKAFNAMQKLKQDIGERSFILAINISSQQLKNQQFANQVLALASKYHIDATCIEFEITETSFVEHDASSIEVINQLKLHGFRFALDDFGTGYTAFNQLRNLPVDTLKIDRSFIGNIDNEGVDRGELVDVILSLAQRYNLNVVAEGVENQHQLDYLIKRNCAHFQGYFLSKPISMTQLTELLAPTQVAKETAMLG